MKKPKTYKYTATIEFRTDSHNKIKDFRSILATVLDGNATHSFDYKIVSIKKSESIKVRSAKNKGVKLQNWVAEKISNMTGIPWGKDELIRARPMGQSGTDVSVIGRAKELFPYAIECKNCEKFSLPEWIEQAKYNKTDDTDWMLFITKNNYDTIMVMDAEKFFNVYKDAMYYKDSITAKKEVKL